MTEEQRERKREHQRKWKAANPEKVKEHQRKWEAANHEKIMVRLRKWKAANHEKTNESNRKWRAANPEKDMVRQRRVVDKLIPAYVAGRLNIPVSMLTEDLYEIKKLSLQINRRLKNVS